MRGGILRTASCSQKDTYEEQNSSFLLWIVSMQCLELLHPRCHYKEASLCDEDARVERQKECGCLRRL